MYLCASGVIAYFALHQLGRGDIMLPEPVEVDEEDGMARAQFAAPALVSHLPRLQERVYYDAVACYDEFGKCERIFSTQGKWLCEGELVTVTARLFID